MCRLLWGPDESGEFDPPSRADPRLVWAVPMDITKLGASLEAYVNTMDVVRTLRVCHRYGRGHLSTLPQEILELVISELRQEERANTQPLWTRLLDCFRDKCSLESHYTPFSVETELMWNNLFMDPLVGGQSLDPAMFSNKQKADMVTYMLARGDDLYDDPDFDYWPIHEDRRRDWLNRVCLCPDNPTRPSSDANFTRFNQILREHFGLEAIIFHELLPYRMVQFLPDMDVYRDYPYYTICYLTLASGTSLKYVIGGCDASGTQGMVAASGGHLVFRQIFDSDTLVLTEEQRLRFSKAMRVLDVDPNFHLTELEPLIAHPIKEKGLQEICACTRVDCPGKGEPNKDEKLQKLGQYLNVKNQELATQSWPKLMNILASDVTASHEW